MQKFIGIYVFETCGFDTYEEAERWAKELAEEIKDWIFPEAYREAYKEFRPCIYELDSENHYKFIKEF